MENIDEYEFVEENEAPPYHRLQPPPHMGSRGRNTELPSAPQSSPAQGASPSAPEQSYPLLQWPTPGPTLAPLAPSNSNPGSSNSQLKIGFNFPPPPVRPASESQADQRVGLSTPPYHPHAPPLQQFTNFHSFTQVSPLQRSVESRESEAGVSTSAPYSSPITGAASTASSEAVQPSLSFRFEDSFEDRTDRTLPRSGHLSITPNPAVVAQLNKKIEEILTQNEENMRKARQETVEIWQQRLADKEEEWYLEQEVELKKKETQLKAECAQEKAELRAAHAQHITSLEASHGQHIAKL